MFELVEMRTVEKSQGCTQSQERSSKGALEDGDKTSLKHGGHEREKWERKDFQASDLPFFTGYRENPSELISLNVLGKMNTVQCQIMWSQEK